MEDKNELNDLLLGEETKSGGGGKKLFLIIAGALLVFFVTIGIMKFVNSGDDKANTNATKVAKEVNASGLEANKTTDMQMAPNDEKLNEIVRKLQEDAKTQQGGAATTPLDSQSDKNVTTPKATPVNVPIKKAEPTPTPAPIAVAKPEPVPAAAPAPKAPATAVVPKEAKDVLKEATKQSAPAPKVQAPTPAPKPVAKPQAQPKKEPVAKTEPVPAKAVESQGGGYYIQVGYADSDKSAEPIKTKASGAGYKVITKQAQVKDKSVTKIFVGPFNTKEEAEKEKAKVREQIKNDAFVVKG